MLQAGSTTFLYLGRGVAFSSFVLELAEATHRHNRGTFSFMVADRGLVADRLEHMGIETIRIPTFAHRTPFHVAQGFLRARRLVEQHLTARRPGCVVTLMPHVWSPLMSPRIKRLGIRYATVVHDAVPHPGDPTAWATSWLLRDVDSADVIVSLSRNVAEEIARRRPEASSRIVTLFHPDLRNGSGPVDRRFDRARPLRILFFGRIMAYKGLPLLVEAVEILRRDGHAIHLGVAGRGGIRGLTQRLAALNAEVLNDWLSDADLAGLLARYDVMACSHIEASQSGVAALAFGNTMPVVATPVGGITEQVVDGRNGIVSAAPTARAFADAI
ncbi:MAG: glycosyltransferase family 4 protein, partial [Hyphomicrobium sp.]|nr:glycosyltransferase family 4 protein [Hyphomicrobium sp.]